jgi:hypothetical protein
MKLSTETCLYDFEQLPAMGINLKKYSGEYRHETNALDWCFAGSLIASGNGR